MADTGAAQNKLGQLFVDIGVGGLGKTLKALNSVSASFLLTKNAAVQMAAPLINIGSEAMKGAVGVGKLGASFGTTLMEAQKFVYYLKHFNLSEGLLSDLSNIQDKITRARKGYGGIDGQMMMSLNALGLDFWDYDGSAESMLKFVKDVHTAVTQQGLSTQESKMHLQNLGLGNNDWLYAFQRSDFNLDEALSIDDSTIETLIKAKEEFNDLTNRLDLLFKKGAVKFFENGGFDALNKTIDFIDDWSNPDEGQKQEIKNKLHIAGTGAAAVGIGSFFGIGAIPAGIAGATIGAEANSLERLQKQNGEHLTPIGGGGQIDFSVNPFKFKREDLNNDNRLNYNPLPYPIGGIQDKTAYNIDITNNIDINSNNADEIADKIASINAQDIQMTQYQVHNMAGV